jgi:hypothetical protein
VKTVRGIQAFGVGVATVALLAGTALAYGPKVPPGAAPAPGVSAGSVKSSAAPQAVKKTSVSPGTSSSLSYSTPSSNPSLTTTLKVKVPRNAFVTGGPIALQVANQQNLNALQTSFGTTDNVISAFQIASSAKSKHPMLVTIGSPNLIGKFSVFALRPDHPGKPGTGYHYVFVKAHFNAKTNTYTFPVDRNQLYVLVTNTTAK